MPDVSVTIDARAALRAVIARRYGRDIVDPMWSTVTPSDDPPAGLGSQDTTDWQITLDRAVARMATQGYVMAAISPAEAEAARAGVLDDSTALLVAKASAQADAPAGFTIKSRDLMLGAGAGIVAGALVTIGAARRAARNARR